MEAYRLFSKESDYPLHLGITEAGKGSGAIVKSAIGIGLLLNQGIGDTVRVSLTEDPVEEVRVGYEILRALNIRRRGVEIISCPTCGRCEVDLSRLVKGSKETLKGLPCPHRSDYGMRGQWAGEAKEADIGIAGGKGVGVLFKRGKVVRKLKEKDFVSVLLNEIHGMTEER